MKLIRFGEPGKEKTGVMINDKKYDTSAFGEDYGELFFETDGLNRLVDFIQKNDMPEIAEKMYGWAARMACRQKLYASA